MKLSIRNEELRTDVQHIGNENDRMRRTIKKMHKHLRNMEKGIIWRNNLIKELEEELGRIAVEDIPNGCE
jgi:hypothetical protein